VSNPIHLVFLLAILLLWVGPAVLAGRLADRKGRSFGVYLVAALVIGWPLPLLAALIVNDRRAQV
jgi:MFS family permease